MPSIVIAGLGVSGLGCALELTRQNIPFVALEKEGRAGGLAKSEVLDGFRFDYGPHILLGQIADLEELFRPLPGLELAVCSGRSAIALDTRLETVVPAPFQHHLHCLPVGMRARLLFDLAAGGIRNGRPPANYQEYVTGRCGKGVYDLFVRDYDAKRLRFDLRAIPPDWTNRVEKPAFRSLILPAWLTGLFAKRGRENRFLYPRSGGIEALPQAMVRLLPANRIRYGEEVTEIDPKSKRLTLADGKTVFYEYLALSLPLPEIVNLIKEAPAEVRSAAENLLYTSIYVLSLGIEGPIPPWFLLRVPAAEVGFYRLSFPSHYSPDSAPPGLHMVVGEISHHSVRHPLSASEARRQFYRGLEQLGIVRKGQRILAENIRNIRHGHVLYNYKTRSSIEFILAYLRSASILTCGKYGLWWDLLIPDSIRSGMQAAREISRP